MVYNIIHPKPSNFPVLVWFVPASTACVLWLVTPGARPGGGSPITRSSLLEGRPGMVDTARFLLPQLCWLCIYVAVSASNINTVRAYLASCSSPLVSHIYILLADSPIAYTYSNVQSQVCHGLWLELYARVSLNIKRPRHRLSPHRFW